MREGLARNRGRVAPQLRAARVVATMSAKDATMNAKDATMSAKEAPWTRP